MKYSIEKIKAYRKFVNTLEKIISIPARGLIVILFLLAVYPTLGSMEFKGSGEKFIVELKALSYSIVAYLLLNFGIWAALFLWKRCKESIHITKALLIASLVVDLCFISLLLLLGKAIGGKEIQIESSLFWVYCLLIVRSVIYFPQIKQEIAVTALIIVFYLGAYYYGEYDRTALGPLVVILILVNISAWGLYDVYKRRQEVQDEMQERTIRSQRLNLAGLVAKETAHSLKNPLAIINNACYLISTNVNKSDNSFDEHLNIIKRQVERADGIISELTKYSELAGGKIGNADVNLEIIHCIHDLDYEIKRRRITVIEELDNSIPKLMIEENQLRQVLSNILLNACQAIDEKGTITVRTTTDENEEIEIEISDTGKGIADRDMDNIFKAYYTTKEGGTGIGLSIVHTVVQAYNGTISVDSEPGKGTRFTIHFPTRTQKVM